MNNHAELVSDVFIKKFKPLKYPACVYLTENCKCSVLNVRECAGEKCTFLKSEYLKDLSDKKRIKRLNSLDKNEQQKIADAYYGGKISWKR